MAAAKRTNSFIQWEEDRVQIQDDCLPPNPLSVYVWLTAAGNIYLFFPD